MSTGRFGSAEPGSSGYKNATNNPVEKLIAIAIAQHGSDVHVKTNRISRIRIKTTLVDIKIPECQATVNDLKNFCYQYLSTDKERVDTFFDENSSLYHLDATVVVLNRRLRLHMFYAGDYPCATLRLLSEGIPELSKLNLPDGIENFTHLTKGLVLITGSTGSGKTTTIASVVNAINLTRPCFILTIEDPVEYKYAEAMATVEQREVGHDVENFSAATVDALREDPDIIVVGEMRDLETIQNAITLAETGHLVFGTLHAKSVVDAIDRMIDVFPPIQQQQIRIQLASVLAGIVHQQMVHANNQISVLVEMIQFDDVLANMVKTPGGSTANIRDTMRSKADIGCVHLVDNVFWHIQCGRLKAEDVTDRLSEADIKLLQNKLATLKPAHLGTAPSTDASPVNPSNQTTTTSGGGSHGFGKR